MSEIFNTAAAMTGSYHERIGPLRNTSIILSKCLI